MLRQVVLLTDRVMFQYCWSTRKVSILQSFVSQTAAYIREISNQTVSLLYARVILHRHSARYAQGRVRPCDPCRMVRIWCASWKFIFRAVYIRFRTGSVNLQMQDVLLLVYTVLVNSTTEARGWLSILWNIHLSKMIVIRTLWLTIYYYSVTGHKKGPYSKVEDQQLKTAIEQYRNVRTPPSLLIQIH